MVGYDSRGTRIVKTNIWPKNPKRLAAGDSATITLHEDLSWPVRPWIMTLLDDAGFTMPTSGPPAS